MSGSSTMKNLWIEGFKGALFFEGLTCIGRFGLDMQSTRDTARMAKFTMGVRIHHAYPGLLLFVIGMVRRRYKEQIEIMKKNDDSNNDNNNNIISRMFSVFGYHRPYTIYEWCIVGGIALFVSDMIHHILVLWPITGQHQFDLTY